MTEPGQLYGKHPGAAAALANACMKTPGLFAKLVGAWGDAALSKVTATGDDMVNIAGELDVSTAKLATMDEPTLKKLLKVSENPELASEADLKLFEGSGDDNFRLRFKTRVAKRNKPFIDGLLRALGIDKDAPNAKLFKEMSDADQQRLWDISGDKRSAEQLSQAGQYAMSKKPTSVRDSVADFQMYEAEVTQHAARVKARIAREMKVLTDGGKSQALALKEASRNVLGRELASLESKNARDAFRTQALKEMGVEVTVNGETTTQGALDTKKAHDDNVADLQNSNDGPGKRPLGELSDNDLKVAVQAQIDTLSFGSEQDAAYHAHKHRPEMITKDQSKSEMRDYLDTARQIVKDNDGAVRVNQDGSRSVAFADRRGTVIVHVSKDGGASIATYMPSVTP